MDAIDVLLGVAAAGDATLVGDHHEPVAGFAKSAKSLRNPVQQLDARGIPEVAVVGDQGVVTIQKHDRVHAGERIGKQRGG
jgi:hypothetical protein